MFFTMFHVFHFETLGSLRLIKTHVEPSFKRKI